MKTARFYVNFASTMSAVSESCTGTISNAVLEKMGKPSVEVYKKFVKAYKDMNEKLGKKTVLSAIPDVLPSGFYFKGSSRIG